MANRNWPFGGRVIEPLRAQGNSSGSSQRYALHPAIVPDVGRRPVARHTHGMANRIRNALKAFATMSSPERIDGAPPSANGASSFHLRWQCPPHRLSEVSVTLTITEGPQVDKLYFWALQAGFSQGGFTVGAAHLGLQFHPAYPDHTAVNWGGYHSSGSELDGSVSTLPSALNNPNTRDYLWKVGSPYRLRIFKVSGQNRWRGSVTDLDRGSETVVRDLFVAADSLAAPVMWTEAFCACDDPSVSALWSDPVAMSGSGSDLPSKYPVDAVTTTYQRHSDGGCTNTNSRAELTVGFVQQTGCERHNPDQTRLALNM